MNPIMFYQLPAINLDTLVLNNAQMSIVEQIVVKNKNGYNIRSNKPENGIAAYVWRMIMLIVGTNKKYHGYPVTADYYIPYDTYKNRTEKYDGDLRGMKKEIQAKYNNRIKLNAFILNEMDPIIDEVLFNITGRNMNAERKKALAYLEYKYIYTKDMNRALKAFRKAA
jgi:hypothetical protein